MSGAIVDLPDVAGRAVVEDAADYVIVGSGAAGATAARVLTERGRDVVIVEEGQPLPPAARRSDMYSTFRNVWRDMGFQVAEGRAFTPVLQGRCVGGTTVINGAILHRMPEAIHDLWLREHGLTHLPYSELERVYDVLDRELHVGTAPDAVLGENNRLMRQGVEALGWSGNLIRRNVAACEGAAHCNQGCPNGRKQGMDASFVPYAVARGARVYARCRVERVVSKAGRAVGVKARFREPLAGAPGPTLSVHARRGVILAASAIQTPLLLAASGLGGASGLVGERLQAHPGTGVVAIFDRVVKPWFGATQGYETKHFWHERMKFEAVGMPLELLAARLPGFGPELMRQLGDYPHVAIWGVQVRSRAHGTVKRGLFGGKTLRFDMTDDDLETLKLGVFRLCQMAFAAGAREVLPGVHGLPERVTSLDPVRKIFDLPSDPRYFHCIAAHLFGTAVMGRSARHSVVRPDFQTHELPGLYVVDSSVFPTNMGVNPQHTICALAWLAAEGLA